MDPAQVQTDRLGLLDTPVYVAGADRLTASQGQNVSLLAASVSASQLSQFVSLTVAPSGEGETGPVRFGLTTGRLEHLDAASHPDCFWENQQGAGDSRLCLVGEHPAAKAARQARALRNEAASARADAPAPEAGRAVRAARWVQRHWLARA